MRLGMNRASLIYLVVCAVFTFGIWTILELGTAFLTAPRDLGGRWTLEDAATPPEATPPEKSFSISQSGEFVRFSPENGGQHFDVVLTQSSQSAEKTANQTLKFDGDGWHVCRVAQEEDDCCAEEYEGEQDPESPWRHEEAHCGQLRVRKWKSGFIPLSKTFQAQLLAAWVSGNNVLPNWVWQPDWAGVGHRRARELFGRSMASCRRVQQRDAV